jgi:hypothetical protein
VAGVIALTSSFPVFPTKTPKTTGDAVRPFGVGNTRETVSTMRVTVVTSGAGGLAVNDTETTD